MFERYRIESKLNLRHENIRTVTGRTTYRHPSSTIPKPLLEKPVIECKGQMSFILDQMGLCGIFNGLGSKDNSVLYWF